MHYLPLIQQHEQHSACDKIRADEKRQGNKTQGNQGENYYFDVNLSFVFHDDKIGELYLILSFVFVLSLKKI
jgi:hypothetical protein